MQKIVLIDDDRDDAELFGEALAEVMPVIQFSHFDNGREALTTLESSGNRYPDLIFLDINLPIMSGWEVLTSLKKQTLLSQIPVIMYTTSSQKREKEIAIDLGAAGFITKPNDFDELKTVLRTVLDNEAPASRNA